MPEIAVDEDRDPGLGENEIRASGEGLAVLPEIHSRGAEERPDVTFRGCILALDSRHHPAALLR
jgi:hypothetical protein